MEYQLNSDRLSSNNLKRKNKINRRKFLNCQKELKPNQIARIILLQSISKAESIRSRITERQKIPTIK